MAAAASFSAYSTPGEGLKRAEQRATETVLAILLICSLTWNHVPYTSARLLDVACPSWNQVDMAMVNGLACGLPHVDANIETGDTRILRLSSTLCLI